MDSPRRVRSGRVAGTQLRSLPQRLDGITNHPYSFHSRRRSVRAGIPLARQPKIDDSARWLINRRIQPAGYTGNQTLDHELRNERESAGTGRVGGRSQQ